MIHSESGQLKAFRGGISLMTALKVALAMPVVGRLVHYCLCNILEGLKTQ